VSNWPDDRRRTVVARRRTALAAAVAAVVALLAACGGTTSSPDGESSTRATSTPQNVTLPAEGPPRTGGTLTYGLEAESDGFDPTKNRLAPSGTIVGLAIYDPLAAFDADLQPQPYLAESMTSSPDFLRWTIKARPGVTFHDGAPLDGAALKTFFDRARADALVGIAVKNIAAVEVDPSDPLAVVVTMVEPWAAFPVTLTGQLGMVTAPSMADDPDSGRRPVGTGPFVFSEWVPDNRLVLTRNDAYWRTDANGTRLPYLDGVEFRPIADAQTRTASLEAGTIDLMHTTNPRDIAKFQQQAAEGRVQVVVDPGEKEELFVMLNTKVPPFDDLRVRRALAHATDRRQYNTVVNGGLREIADGVFSEGSRWKVDAPYPDYDPSAARALVDEYEAEVGPIRFTLADSGTDSRGIDLLKQQWEAVGMEVDTELIEQSKYIVNAALGDYQAYSWRQFGGVDPDYDYVWWTSENSAEPGQGVALNFARNENPAIDAALKRGRGSDDPEVRRQAYAEVQRLINEDLPYIWLDRAQWALVAQNDVRGITNGPLPDGSPANPIGGPGGFGGVTFLTQTWLTG
jgi:ABC-type transport system substrate-binding protein